MVIRERTIWLFEQNCWLKSHGLEKATNDRTTSTITAIQNNLYVFDCSEFFMIAFIVHRFNIEVFFRTLTVDILIFFHDDAKLLNFRTKDCAFTNRNFKAIVLRWIVRSCYLNSAIHTFQLES
ncbi:hypothetical protein D3C87_1742130 [compost metagenome]